MVTKKSKPKRRSSSALPAKMRKVSPMRSKQDRRKKDTKNSWQEDWLKTSNEASNK
jgi:hypothetical protein